MSMRKVLYCPQITIVRTMIICTHTLFTQGEFIIKNTHINLKINLH